FCIRDSVEPCAQMLVEVFLQDIASLRGRRKLDRELEQPSALGGMEEERKILGRPLLILAPVTSQSTTTYLRQSGSPSDSPLLLLNVGKTLYPAHDTDTE
ncbi:unnamed protein product, partial [Pleuronectes platessa]